MNTRSPKLAVVAMAAMTSLLAAACGEDTEQVVSAAPATDVTDTAAPPDTSDAPDTTLGEYVPPEGDIVGQALTAHVFTTLAGLLVKADLVQAVRADGPFTVFAPLDSAFARVAEAAPDVWTAVNTDDELLAAVLTYHVVADELLAADLVPGEYETLNGASITITEEGGKKFVNGVEIVQSDVMATNGVIHVIDGVLVPEG